MYSPLSAGYPCDRVDNTLVIAYQLHLSLYTSRSLVAAKFIPSLRSNILVCAVIMRENTMENYTINSHAQDTTALQTNAFLTAIPLLLVIDA